MFYDKIKNYANKKNPELFLIVITAFSHAFPFLSLLFITVLYTPLDFGVYSKFYAILFIILPLSSLKFDKALLLTNKLEEKKKLLVLSLISTFSISIIIFLATFFLYYFDIWFFDEIGLIMCLILPFSFIQVGITNVAYYYYNRRGNFYIIGLNRLLRAFFVSILFILLGLYFGNFYGLIIADILGYSLALTVFVPTKKKLFSLFKHKKNDLLKLAKKFINFPKYQVFSEIIAKMSENLPTLLFGILYSVADQGLVAFALRVFAAPVTLISGSVGDVFQKRASDQLIEFGDCSNTFKKTSKFLFKISIIPFIISLLFLKNAANLFIDESNEWYEIINVMYILLPYLFLQFNVSCLGRMLVIANKLKLDLVIQIFLLIFLVSGIYAGKYIFDSFNVSLSLFTFIYCLKYIVEYNYSKRLTTKI